MNDRWSRPITSTEALALLAIWAAVFGTVVVFVRLFADQFGW